MEPQNKENTFEFSTSHFVDSFIRVGKELIIKPRFFFRQLPRKGSLKNPFVFLVVCAFLSSLFMANLKNGDYNLFCALLFANTLSAFVGSFVLHGIVSKIFGSKVPFDATFRIIAYASLMDMGSWVPILGPIAYFYSLYLIFLGLQEIHQLQPRQAGAAILSIVFMITLLLLCLILLAPEGWNEGIKLIDPEKGGFR